MYVTEEQLETIKVPKLDCQRGLERYIVDQHWGDKTVFTGKTSYLYLNNPVYRVGYEGDPGSIPFFTSRSLQKSLKPTESALHTVHPTIDSGSVFIEEKPWDQSWGYDREDMPNVIEESANVRNGEIAIKRYNDTVRARDVAETVWDRKSRFLPIYDNSRITNDEEPDNVHNHNPHDPGISPVPYLLPDYSNEIENFTNIRDSRRGYYGLEVPDSYGRMGYEHRNFNFRPKGDQKLLNLSTVLGNIGSLMTPIANRATGAFDSTNFTSIEGFQQLNNEKDKSSQFLILIVGVAIVAILCLLIRNKNKS